MSRCQEHPHEQVPVAAAAISLFASLSSVLELVLDVVQKNTKKSQTFGAEGINFLSGSAGTSDLGQLHTVLPSSKTAFLDLFSRLSFLSGPTGTTDSPGASPSAWASSKQSSQRARPFFFRFVFRDLIFCPAHREPQIHLVHPHQPGPAPHSPPSEQNCLSIFTFTIYFSVWPHRDHRFTWCIPISLGQLHTVLPASKTAFSDLHSFFFCPAPPGTTDSLGAPPSASASSTQSSQRARPLFSIFIFAICFLSGPTKTTESLGSSSVSLKQLHAVPPASKIDSSNSFSRFVFLSALSGAT